MHRVGLFVEDFGHEVFLKALLKRMARQHQIKIDIQPRSMRGGHGKMLEELKQYLRDLKHGQESLPDLLIVGRDGNCKGYLERKHELDSASADFSGHVIYAIPDPHIERWLLLDSAAFKSVLGKGCVAPDQKCERNRYKDLLLKAVREAGITPLLGGMEHAEDLVNAMDLEYLERADDSLGRLLKALRAKFKEWKQA